MAMIKYRAWSKKNNRMYYATFGKGYIESNGEWWAIYEDEDKRRASSSYGDILMQCTGLKDTDSKPSKEIFEGDIVLCYGGQYCQGHWEYHEIIEVDSIQNPQTMMSLMESEYREIMGNIYQSESGGEE